jgi:hypothetical protein
MKLKSIFTHFLVVICLGTLSISAQTTASEEVNSLITKKRKFNKENGYGFRIQLFYGSETNAKTELKSFKIKFPSIKTYIDYSNPPYWKSLVGDYKTRLQADKILNDIKIKFPSAIVVPR